MKVLHLKVQQFFCLASAYFQNNPSEDDGRNAYRFEIICQLVRPKTACHSFLRLTFSEASGLKIVQFMGSLGLPEDGAP